MCIRPTFRPVHQKMAPPRQMRHHAKACDGGFVLLADAQAEANREILQPAGRLSPVDALDCCPPTSSNLRHTLLLCWHTDGECHIITTSFSRTVSPPCDDSDTFWLTLNPFPAHIPFHPIPYNAATEKQSTLHPVSSLDTAVMPSLASHPQPPHSSPYEACSSRFSRAGYDLFHYNLLWLLPPCLLPDSAAALPSTKRPHEPAQPNMSRS